MKNTYTTKNGIELLKDWNDYETHTRTATKAAQMLQSYLYFEGGRREAFAGDSFGLPYTSSSSFAAVWNVNASARLIIFPALYFDGVAIDTNGAPVGIFTERDNDGNEKNTVFLKLKD